MSTFYRPLKNHHIRLLAVVPGAHARDLRFEFWHVSITEQIPYTAVSYNWNHAAGQEVIHVDEKPLIIKRNLWKCLQCLRLTWRCIWADAVCINQSDVDERNYQVAIMGSIYENAAVVSVWLGDIVQDDVSPAEVFRERQASNLPGLHNRKLVPSLGSFGFDYRLAALDYDDGMLDLEYSIYNIARANYWKRAWIIQEFLLARKVHLYYGDVQIDEALFRAVLLEAAGLNGDTTISAVLSNRKNVLEEWPPIILAIQRQLKTRTQRKRSLYELLRRHANMECWDPKDVIFSLLSLIKADESIMLKRCFPDYSVDYRVVAFVALAHLKHFTGDLPLQPLVRALKLEVYLEERERLLLFHALDLFDYERSSDPARDAQQILDEFKFEHRRRHVKSNSIEDYINKLNQPGTTLNGLCQG